MSDLLNSARQWNFAFFSWNTLQKLFGCCKKLAKMALFEKLKSTSGFLVSKNVYRWQSLFWTSLNFQNGRKCRQSSWNCAWRPTTYHWGDCELSGLIYGRWKTGFSAITMLLLTPYQFASSSLKTSQLLSLKPLTHSCDIFLFPRMKRKSTIKLLDEIGIS